MEWHASWLDVGWHSHLLIQQSLKIPLAFSFFTFPPPLMLQKLEIASCVCLPKVLQYSWAVGFNFVLAQKTCNLRVQFSCQGLRRGNCPFSPRKNKEVENL